MSGVNTINEAWLAARGLVAGGFTDEEAIREFEKKFAESVGTAEAISFGAARMGLYAVLEALDFKPDDEIILTGYTCEVVPNALVFRGLKPVYVDIDAVTFNIDAAKIEAAITRRTRAIIMQHTFGVCADVGAIREIAEKHGLRVIEDAAHSKGTSWQGVPSGALGEVAVFSTDRSKMFSTLLGGMVTTSNRELARRLRKIQGNALFLDDRTVRRILFSLIFEVVFYSPQLLWLGLSVRTLGEKLGVFFYYYDLMLDAFPANHPYPSRLSAVQARIGLSQLQIFPENLKHRREIAAWLQSRAGWYHSMAPGEQSCMRYPILVRDSQALVQRMKKRFDLKGWCSIPYQSPARNPENTGYTPGSCPIAEKVSRHIVTFPTHPKVPLGVIQVEWMKHEKWILENLVRL
ncbi:MAG: aminotransferase class I/II-fold pyridoxal phosphate-dependent enzyme [Deltaproteobacteria bacterium]|nr:aminotransferase class I/II-fold pyridoxal phosphate-dependent enzyme [Deltaproteobacteria bacterium]